MLARPGTIGKAPSVNDRRPRRVRRCRCDVLYGICCGAADRGRARYTD